MFKHFVKYFNLNSRFKRADTPARIRMLELIKRSILAKTLKKSEDLSPFMYSTDGGTYKEMAKYFINNIFKKTSVCYTTHDGHYQDVNLQAYLGR